MRRAKRGSPNAGAGKTYTAITAIYRLIKHAGAKRVQFLVDTNNLGKNMDNLLDELNEALVASERLKVEGFHPASIPA